MEREKIVNDIKEKINEICSLIPKELFVSLFEIALENKYGQYDNAFILFLLISNKIIII